MVTTKYIKLGWCNQFVAGRTTLEQLLTYVPELKENTYIPFLEDLKRRRELRRTENATKQSVNHLSFAERYPATKAFSDLVKHAQKVTGLH